MNIFKLLIFFVVVGEAYLFYDPIKITVFPTTNQSQKGKKNFLLRGMLKKNFSVKKIVVS